MSQHIHERLGSAPSGPWDSVGNTGSSLDVWTESSVLVIQNNENTFDSPAHSLDSFFLSGFSWLLSTSGKTIFNSCLDLSLSFSFWLMFLDAGFSSSCLIFPPSSVLTLYCFFYLLEDQTTCKVSLPWARIGWSLPMRYMDTDFYGSTGLIEGLWGGRIVRWFILDTDIFCLLRKEPLALLPIFMSERSTADLLGDVHA